MDRRSFLRLIAAGLVSSAVDTEKLLWIPGEKTIFIPSSLRGIHHPSISEIMALEWERVSSLIPALFERDDTFYANIKRRDVNKVSKREMRIPLIIRPGHND